MVQSTTPDPFDLALAPPPNETPTERTERIKLEQDALERSKKIDAELKLAKGAMKRYNNAVKILVLGQSLSGKSTTVKNFQMTYAKKSWAEERNSWNAVVLLNLVRSVNSIVDILLEDQDATEDDVTESLGRKGPTEKHRKVMLRLLPLRQIEKDLKGFLGAAGGEVAESAGNTDVPPVQLEFSVRSSSGWKSIFDHVRQPSTGKESQVNRIACNVVASCREEIKWLWNDDVTQEALRNRQLRLEDAPGFFLNDIDRITEKDYEPSDEDIVRARLRTTGVQEYSFTMDQSNGTSLAWIIYDVAGIRTSRAAWIPYFKEITALIFLAPISAFNERLAEDRRVNRLEDTFVLWKTICKSPLLIDVQFILFLNKTDLLRKKLQAGARVQKYIPEFSLENDFETVSLWFRKVFKRMYHDGERARTEQPFIAHFTSVVDTKATARTLQAVQATIIRKDISEAGLI